MEGKTREEKSGMGRKKQLNPRQRMINLLYIVLMAMLAINVSNDVMDGCHTVDSWLRKSEAVTEDDNRLLLSQLEKQARLTPRKAAPWQWTSPESKERFPRGFHLLFESVGG